MPSYLPTWHRVFLGGGARSHSQYHASLVDHIRSIHPSICPFHLIIHPHCYFYPSSTACIVITLAVTYSKELIMRLAVHVSNGYREPREHIICRPMMQALRYCTVLHPGHNEWPQRNYNNIYTVNVTTPAWSCQLTQCSGHRREEPTC